MGSREGWQTLGAGLIGIGQNYQAINQQDTTLRMEEAAEQQKQQRLSRTDMMTNLYAGQDRDLAERKFAADTQFNKDSLDAQIKATEADDKLAKSNFELTESIAKYGSFAQQKTAEYQSESLNQARERLELDTKSTAERTALMDREVTLNEANAIHNHAMDQARIAIQQGNYAIALEELQLAKSHQNYVEEMDTKRFEQSENTIIHDQDIAKQNLAIRQADLLLKQQQINNSKTSEEERIRLQGEANKLKEQIFDWEKHNRTLDDQAKLIDIEYKKAVTQSTLAEIARKNATDKYVYKVQQVDVVVGEDKVTGEPILRSEDRIVAINVETQDFKMIRPDGTWLNGSPRGWEHHLKIGIVAIDRLLNSNPSWTSAQAITEAKKLQPEYDHWDTIGQLFIQSKTVVDKTETPLTNPDLNAAPKTSVNPSRLSNRSGGGGF